MLPEGLLSAFALATVTTVMVSLGLDLRPGEFLDVWRRPGMLLKALFSALVGVPAIALAVVRTVHLPWAAEVGLVLMAVSPGAPLALQRSLGAGALRAFAPGLQVTLALSAIVSMPVWIAALDEVYAGHAVVAPWELMKQVLLVQLLPLSLGVGIGRTSATAAAWLKSRLRVVGRGLIAIFMVLVLVAYWGVLVRAGTSVLLSAAAITAGALAIGHTLGGPDPGTRTAVAVSSAVRNPGLALLVAALNGASPGVKATLLAYVFVSAAVVLPYAVWRRRAADRIEHTGVHSHG